MAPTLLVCALLTAVQAEPPKPADPTVRLTVHPAAAPRPALRYQLLPELKEMTPGNPILNYLRCFGEQQNFFFNRAAIDDRERWQTMPLAELPLKDLHNYGGHALRQADEGARMETPDWQILLKARREGLTLLLPEIQQLRTLAGALKVRARVEVAERRYDAALGTTKTLVALGRHLGEHPSLVGNLVGMAIVNVGLGPVEELIQQPDSPNLFWAITDLPHPLFDLHKASHGDRMLVEVELAKLALDRPLTAAQLQETIEKVGRMLQTIDPPKKDAVAAWLAERSKDEGHVRAARQRLTAAGWAEALVRDMPAQQVVLADEQQTSLTLQDEAFKWMALPYWQAEAGMAAAAKAADATLFGRLGVGRFAVRKAQARLEQRLALLCHVEALRLYAADHGGKLPAKLADVGLPLPVDPVTGQPFAYKVEGATAHLQGTPPTGEEKNPHYQLQYQVTIAK